MELDDLRRQWQQPEILAQPLPDVVALLNHRSANLADKMRRNALLEASLTVLLVVAVPFVPLHPSPGTPLPLLVAMRVLLVLLLLALVYYYYQMLRLLRRLVQPEVQVRTHLAALCVGLRQLLRFYYRLSLFTVPAVVALMIGFQMGRELAHKTHHWGKLGIFAGSLLLLGMLLQVAMVYGTRWWVQRLYGQHLDRLEGQLRELDEVVAPRSEEIG